MTDILASADLAIATFDKYYSVQHKRCAGSSYDEFGIESKKRLLQSRKLISRIIAQVSDVKSLPLGAPPFTGGSVQEWGNSPELQKWDEWSSSPEWKQQANQQSDIADDIELDTETFYWISWRCRTALCCMPGLKKFTPTGVLNVRNWLLEHPENKKSGVILGSFALGGSDGPILKAMRWDHQRDIFPDAGLYKNGTEFFVKLTGFCQRYIDSKSASK